VLRWHVTSLERDVDISLTEIFAGL
jgi:hypothetical protein